MKISTHTVLHGVGVCHFPILFSNTILQYYSPILFSNTILQYYSPILFSNTILQYYSPLLSLIYWLLYLLQAMLEAHWPLSKKYWKLYKYVFGACWFLRELLRQRKKKKTNFVTEPAAIKPTNYTALQATSPTSPKRTETLSAGIGIPLVARLTTFPMYDPSLYTSEEKLTPKSTPKARKRISVLMAVTPKYDKRRRISVINKTTPAKVTPKAWDNSNSCKYIVEMSSCSLCPSCHCYVYDEDTMASWSPSESEYNTV